MYIKEYLLIAFQPFTWRTKPNYKFYLAYVVYFINRWVNCSHAANNLSSNKALINTVKTEMFKDSSKHWSPFWMMELSCRCYTTWASFYQKQNSKHLTEQLQEWSLGKWTVCNKCPFQFLTCVQLIYSPLPAIGYVPFRVIQIRISDGRSVWIMVHQRNQWIHSGHGLYSLVLLMHLDQILILIQITPKECTLSISYWYWLNI